MELGVSHMQVTHRGGGILVPQQLLDVNEMSTIFQQIRRTGVPKLVERNPLFSATRHDAAESVTVKWTPVFGPPVKVDSSDLEASW